MLLDIKLARLPGSPILTIITGGELVRVPSWPGCLEPNCLANGLARCHVITLFSLVGLSLFGRLARLASWPGGRASLSRVIRTLHGKICVPPTDSSPLNEARPRLAGWLASHINNPSLTGQRNAKTFISASDGDSFLCTTVFYFALFLFLASRYFTGK